jgi:hypothetical protein
MSAEEMVQVVEMYVPQLIVLVFATEMPMSILAGFVMAMVNCARLAEEIAVLLIVRTIMETPS